MFLINRINDGFGMPLTTLQILFLFMFLEDESAS